MASHPSSQQRFSKLLPRFVLRCFVLSSAVANEARKWCGFTQRFNERFDKNMSKKYKCPHCPATFNSSDVGSLSVFTCGGCNRQISLKKKSTEAVSDDKALDWLGDHQESRSRPIRTPPTDPEPRVPFTEKLKKAPVGNYAPQRIGGGGDFLGIQFKSFVSTTIASALWVLAITVACLAFVLNTIGSVVSISQGAGEIPPMPDMSLAYSDFDSITEYYDHLSEVRAYERAADYSPEQALLGPVFAALFGAAWLLVVRLGLEVFVVIFRIYEELRVANQKP